MKTPAGRAYIYKRTRRSGPRYTRLRHVAKLLGVTLTITREEYEELIKKPCAYCGGPTGDTGSGLDRIIPSQSYSLRNVVPSCGVCNRIKNNVFTFEEMLEIGEVIRRVRARRPLPTTYQTSRHLKQAP